MAIELTIPQRKTLERVLRKKREALSRKNSQKGDYGDKICLGCHHTFKITCKANIKNKLYCRDSCKR